MSYLKDSYDITKIDDTPLGKLLRLKSLLETAYRILISNTTKLSDKYFSVYNAAKDLAEIIKDLDFDNNFPMLVQQKNAIMDLFDAVEQEYEMWGFSDIQNDNNIYNSEDVSPFSDEISSSSEEINDFNGMFDSSNSSPSLSNNLVVDGFDESIFEDPTTNSGINNNTRNSDNKEVQTSILNVEEMFGETNTVLAEQTEQLNQISRQIEEVNIIAGDNSKPKSWIESLKENRVVVATVLVSSFVFSAGGVLLSDYLSKKRNNEEDKT